MDKEPQPNQVDLSRRVGRDESMEMIRHAITLPRVKRFIDAPILKRNDFSGRHERGQTEGLKR